MSRTDCWLENCLTKPNESWAEQKESVHFYQLAVGCASDAVVNLHEPLRPAVIRILRHIVEIARRKGIPVSMCGGMAAFSDWAELTMNNPGELT